MTAPLHLSLADAVMRVPPDRRVATLLERGDAATVKLYMPVGYDDQTAHDRDELYVVAAGCGQFSCGDGSVGFGPGDLLCVPAHTPHRFDHFDLGFAAWVIFYGPARPPPG